MYTNLKNTISDILYVSKITQTKNKKLVIIFSVVLSCNDSVLRYSNNYVFIFVLKQIYSRNTI